MRLRVVLFPFALAGFVACDDGAPRTGALEVSAVTTGGDPDLDGYTVSLGGNDPQALGVNDTLVITGLPAGLHDVELAGLADNCTVSDDNPRPVRIAGADTVPLAFRVACRATGVLVSVAVVGIDLDPDGFTVSVDGAPPHPVSVLGSVLVTRLTAGPHQVTLGGLAPNCTVADGGTHAVTVNIAVTVPVEFRVTCVALTAILQVTAATAGADPDPNGYTLRVDDAATTPLASNGTASLQGLTGGDHSVRLDDAAGNCAVSGDNPRTVTVATGGLTRDTARTSFSVTCFTLSGVVRISAVTTGIDVDLNGYTAVRVSDGVAQPLPPNGTVTFQGLPGGSHSFRLDGAAGNCAVGGENPRSLVVTVGGLTRDTARTTFAVGCVATTGSLEVTAVTSGPDPDPNGFTLQVDGSPYPLVANGTRLLEGLGGGDHNVTLSDISNNCTLAGSDSRTLSIATGGLTRDTARTTFDLTCVRVEKIAFTRGSSSVVVAYGDGSNELLVAPQGRAPAWSPDGSRIVYGAFDCYDYYYYDYCYPTGLFVVNADGSQPARLTADPNDIDPSWRPDGSRIAFTRWSGAGNRLFIMNADGSGAGAVPLPAGVVEAFQPAWSPDGTMIAFTCRDAGGNVDVCRVNPDGSGFVRLTDDAARDAGPAWKPDGTAIAFATSRFSGLQEIARMDPDGAGVTRIATGQGAYQPSWSADGARIAFVAFACDIYGGCTALGLAVVNADGTGRMPLTGAPDTDPAWRP